MNQPVLYRKLKRANLNRFLLEVADPSPWQWFTFGKALERRFRLLDSLLLSVKRGKLSEQDLLNHLSGLMVIRQTEEDLGLYQDQLEALTGQLQAGEISESQFEERLAAMAGAMLLLMYFLGSQSGDEDRLAELRLTLETAGAIVANLDLSDLPEEAASQLREMMALTDESAVGLSLDITAGDYADNQGSLAARLALWLGTAAGIYALGQLFREDADNIRYEWGVGPTEHCKDCRGLNGQVHTAAQWREFASRTDKRPQGAGLECHGFKCLCYLVETDKAISGDFV